jgi:hypothetical protein
MGIRPQNRIPKLAIVGPTDKKPRQQPAGQRWWGPPRHPHLDQAIQAPPKPYRMTVMPALPRCVSWIVLKWIWNFLRGYFVTETPRKGGAVVLSFRSHGTPSPGFSHARAESFTNKKVSGSVGWNSECEVSPQEGGRG